MTNISPAPLQKWSWLFLTCATSSTAVGRLEILYALGNEGFGWELCNDAEYAHINIATTAGTQIRWSQWTTFDLFLQQL